MKDWVKPFLAKETEKTLKGAGESEDLIKEALQSLETVEFVWYRLTNYFQLDFGGGLGGPNQWMTEGFGCVLSDLPEEVFMSLKDQKNIVFLFTPFPGPEVKLLDFPIDIKAGDLIKIVTFPYETSFKPELVAKGLIAHELAHLY